MKYLSVPLISLFILSACVQSAPGLTPAAVHSAFDPFVTFNGDGYATLRGRIGGGSQCPGDDGLPGTIFMALEVPITLEDISAKLSIPFSVTLATQMKSERVSETTARDFFIANPNSSFTDAFLPGETVEVTFVIMKDKLFVASAVRQIEAIDSAQFVIKKSDILNASEMKIDYSSQIHMPHPSEKTDDFEWIVAYPVPIHGTESHILFPIKVTKAVEYVSINGQVSSISYSGIDQYRLPNLPNSALIQFKHKPGVLEAIRISEVGQKN